MRGFGDDQINRTKKAKTAVLKALEDGKWHRFIEVVEITKMSPATISKYLKAFKKEVEKKRDLRSGKYPIPVSYKLTELGQKTLAERKTLDHIETPNKTFFKTENKDTLPKMLLGARQDIAELVSVESWYDLSPEGKVFIDTLLVFDEEHKEKIATMVNELKRKKEWPEVYLGRLCSEFVDLFKGVIRAAGNTGTAKHEEMRSKTGLVQVRDMIMEEKRALNFEATLLLHFDGKEVVRAVNWEKLLQDVEKGDSLMKQGYEDYREAISKPGVERKNWIIDTAIEDIRNTETNELPTFLAKSLSASFSEIGDIVKDPWNVLNSSSKPKEALVQRRTTDISITKGFNHDQQSFSLPSKDEIKEAEVEVRKTIEEMLKEGIIEIAPIYLFKLNKEKAKEAQLKAKKGYPSPIAVFAERAFQVPREGKLD
jgi:DNA-binding HxlR family transcriptional regulator